VPLDHCLLEGFAFLVQTSTLALFIARTVASPACATLYQPRKVSIHCRPNQRLMVVLPARSAVGTHVGENTTHLSLSPCNSAATPGLVPDPHQRNEAELKHLNQSLLPGTEVYGNLTHL